jgi:hypothetical protein
MLLLCCVSHIFYDILLFYYTFYRLNFPFLIIPGQYPSHFIVGKFDLRLIKIITIIYIILLKSKIVG